MISLNQNKNRIWKYSPSCFVLFFFPPCPYLTLHLPCRCEALQHSGQLSRGDQAVWLWSERAAHRFHGQLLCWNAFLHVGESARRPHPRFLWPHPHFPSLSFLTRSGTTLYLLSHSPAKRRGPCPGERSLAHMTTTVFSFLPRCSFSSCWHLVYAILLRPTKQLMSAPLD